jgi:hypothetical protein
MVRMPDSWGRPWAQVVAGPLAEATCLWQDLDGLHVAAAPADAPPTSIVWGWRADGSMVRVRLDGDAAFVAELGSSEISGAGRAVRTVNWDVRADGRGDARVAGVRAPGVAPEVGPGAEYEQVVVTGIGDGVGPVTFVRPARG